MWLAVLTFVDRKRSANLAQDCRLDFLIFLSSVKCLTLPLPTSGLSSSGTRERFRKLPLSDPVIVRRKDEGISEVVHRLP